MADSSVPALKRAFLNAQVRILSAPLEPTEEWREQGGEVPAEGDLDDKTVDAVIGKVNALLKSHNATAFPAPVLAHVAAQIDALYWSESAPGLGDSSLPADTVSRSLDLSLASNIASLPDEWSEVGDETMSSPAVSSKKRKSTASRTSGLETYAEGARYKQLKARLAGLAEERERAKKKVEQVTRLAEAMRSLEQPGETVQKNLVTRDGELQRELERMVVLAARVGGKLGASR